jgi:hypothetical protein
VTIVSTSSRSILSGVRPFGRVAAQRERDGVHDHVADQQDPLFRQVRERITRRDGALVVQHLDVSFAEFEVQPIRKRHVRERVTYARLLFEKHAILVEHRLQRRVRRRALLERFQIIRQLCLETRSSRPHGLLGHRGILSDVEVRG